MNFKDKVAAITGAGSGIGRALAVALAKRGCHLALSDINLEGLKETAALARVHNVKVAIDVVDVSDRQTVYDWARKTVAEFGKINLVFNNAGVALGGTIPAVEYKDFEWIMGINFWGVVYGSKAFLPFLHASGEGHIVNVSSVFGLFSVPTQGTYNASKFAVRGFTEALRQDLEVMGSPVKVTCVHPGGIKTNIARAARFAKDLAARQDPQKLTSDFEKMFITTPEKAAATILRAVEKGERRVLIGPDAVVLDLMVRLLPAGYQRIVTKAFSRQMKDKPASNGIEFV